MTETREISRDSYREISYQAHDLFVLINGLMNSISSRSGEWADLHNLMKLAGVISDFTSRYSTEAPDRDAPDPDAPDPDAPIPYLPADGMRDLDAAVKAANPGHAIYADTLDVEPF
jgi:septal ring-binding cell division protein DamX